MNTLLPYKYPTLTDLSHPLVITIKNIIIRYIYRIYEYKGLLNLINISK